MQIPISLALTPEASHQHDVSSIPPGVVLSVESQLKLRALYDYVDFSRVALDEIRRDLCLNVYEPEGPVDLRRALETLEKFCIEADSWGFDQLYEVALGLQMFLMNSGGRIRHDELKEPLRRGLSMLPGLLEQCERDFCWRLAVGDLLECLDRASSGN